MDYNALRLKHSGDPARLDEILQAECREKCARKLPETLKCSQFRFPSTALAEMSTGDAAAGFHASLVREGDTVLDMTFGLGIDSFHIARRASSVTGIEIDPVAAAVGAANASALGLENVEVISADSVEWLAESDRYFSVIFIDPARRDKAGRHFSLADSTPDVTECMSLLLSRCTRLIIKCSPMLDIAALRRDLEEFADVIVVGTSRECKELVAVVPGNGATEAVTTGHGVFRFSPAEEAMAAAFYDTPQAGGYLYEPFPAVMKAAPLRLLSSRTGASKLAPNTHLYYSAEVLPSFPGEAFKILEVTEFNKRSLRDIASRYPKINVATRNFPLSAPALAAKAGITEGGDLRLFGVTLADNHKYLIITDNDPHYPIASAADSAR